MKFISFFIALVLCLSFLVVPVSVSAADSDLTLAEPPANALNNWQSYSGGSFFPYWFVVSLENTYYVINFNASSDLDMHLRVNASDSRKQMIVVDDSDNKQVSCNYLYLSYRSNGSISCTKGNASYMYLPLYSNHTLSEFADSIYYSSFDVYSDGLKIYDTVFNHNVTIENFLSLSAGGGSDSDSDSPLYGIYLDRHEETWTAFIQWLINNGYYTELAAFGLRVNINNLSSIADTWWNNKFSPSLFWELLKNNGLNSLENAKKVISWFNNKWEDYLSHNAVQEIWNTNNNKDFHHRAGLIEDETDEDGNITDTVDISILREILRQIINLPANIYSYGGLGSAVKNIATNVYAVCNSVSSLPSYIANNVDYVLNDDFNSLIDAINNIKIEGGSGGNVTNNYYYDNDNKSDYDTALADYIPRYQAAINAKVPAVAQCEALFDEVISAMENSSGGEHSNLTGGSSGSDTDNILLSGFSAAFPAFDSSYVNAASDAGAPAVAVNVAGTRVNIIDFRIFGKWRTLIHAVISLFAWVSFALSLWKSFPSLVGGVSSLSSVVLSASSTDILSPSEFEAEAILEAEQQHLFDD